MKDEQQCYSGHFILPTNKSIGAHRVNQP